MSRGDSPVWTKSISVGTVSELGSWFEREKRVMVAVPCPHTTVHYRSQALRLFEHVQAEVERFREDLTDKVENKRGVTPSELLSKWAQS
jgi:hypothetical protein